MENLIKKIKNDANINNLWEKDSKIIVGVSGGPDSVCLFDILARIKKKSKMGIFIAHVNYDLRGKDSKEDEKLVRSLARKYQVKLDVLKVKGLNSKKISEESLRDIRYSFFEKLRKKNNYDLIAVAHNQDDQVETFFMHLLRGAGLQGLSAMKHKNGKIIRPLLGISRKEILCYLNLNKLEYRIDRTNLDNDFFRNKIRNLLIPYLEEKFNPSIKNTVCNSMKNVAEDLSLIQELFEKYIGEKIIFKASEILKLHPALQRRIILKEIENKKGNLKNIESSHVDEVIKIIRSKKNKNQIFKFQGLKLIRKGDTLNMIKLTK